MLLKICIKSIEDKIPDITNLASNTTLNAEINDIKGQILSITNLATTTVLNAELNEVKNKIATTIAPNAVENRTPYSKNLVKKLTITPKLMKLKRKLLLIMIMVNSFLLKNLVS